MQLYFLLPYPSRDKIGHFNSTIDAIILIFNPYIPIFCIYFNSTIDAIIQVHIFATYLYIVRFQFYYRCNYTYIFFSFIIFSLLFQFYYRCNYTMLSWQMYRCLVTYFNSTIDAIIRYSPKPYT